MTAVQHEHRWVCAVESWELDALDPSVLIALIQGEIDTHRDDRLWAETTTEMETQRFLLGQASERWEEVVVHLRGDLGDLPDDDRA